MHQIKDLAGEALALLARRPCATPTRKPGALRKAAAVIPSEIAACFERFETRGDAELERMLLAAVRFCSEMASAEAPARWLTLLGDPGCGKTTLAKCVIRFLRRHLDGLRDENYTSAVRYRAGGLKVWGDQVLEMVGGDYTGLRNLREDWLVCLDDVGTEYEKHRELSRSKLFEVLNARAGRWTVITANLSLDQICHGMDPRISSRLIRDGSEVVDSQAVDFARRQNGALTGEREDQ